MVKLKGTGMLAVWSEVPPEHEEEFNEWYNQEHISERLSVPGVLSAARYEAVKSGPKHLAVYELEHPSVMQSSEYVTLKNNPTKWSKRMSPDVIGTTYIRNVYEMIFPTVLTYEVATSPTAPALQVGRMNIPNNLDNVWNDWYNQVYVPNYETVKGVIRGRRYQAVEGSPKYMTFYELESAMVSQTEEWQKQQTAHPANEKMREAMQHEFDSPGIWVKTFELE